MIINLIVIFLILLFGFIYSQGSNQDINSGSNRKKYIKVICFILILQSGLRNVAVGSDTYTYFLYFEDVKRSSWGDIYKAIFNFYELGEGKDIGYVAFEKLVQVFTNEYQIFLLVIAVIFFTALGNFIYKNTTKLKDSIIAFVIYSVLFYSFFSITGHRQTLATAGTFFAFEFLKRKRLIPFVVIILIASTIHKSCLVFILLYFLSYIKNIKIPFWIVLLLFPILMGFSSIMAKFISVFLNSYEEYEHLEEYKPVTFVVLMLFIAVLSLIRYNKIIVLDKGVKNYYAGLMVGILFLSLVFEIHGYMRVVQYFSIFILLLIPLILRSFDSFDKKHRSFIYSISIIILLSFFIKANLNMEYKFFWQEMKLEKLYD
ncbi:EpsG family protein [Flavobacterium sp. DSP2-3-1]|uniref:EpsG family protein n=1 Tax=unclassified Flavobacterium TaxID=196869 RepID=UPI003CF25A54